MEGYALPVVDLANLPKSICRLVSTTTSRIFEPILANLNMRKRNAILKKWLRSRMTIGRTGISSRVRPPSRLPINFSDELSALSQVLLARPHGVKGRVAIQNRLVSKFTFRFFNRKSSDRLPIARRRIESSEVHSCDQALYRHTLVSSRSSRPYSMRWIFAGTLDQPRAKSVESMPNIRQASHR